MMKHLKLAGFLLLIGFAATSCRRDYDPVPPTAREIFPIQDGKFRIYHVIDTSYASATLEEAKSYYRRETTDGTETDLLDREVSKLWLHVSPDSLGTAYNWDFFELWTQYLGDEFAERIEGNTRKLILRWPPYKDATWNGNLYNANEDQTYRYVNIDTTIIVGGKTYEHCVFVLQVPFRMPVEKIPGNPPPPFFLIEHAYEIYAPKIGKIVGYYKYYEEQVLSGNVHIDEDSYIYYEELVDHNY
jgi:hypothetical protein